MTTFTGTPGNDIWTGGSADDVASGGAGNDQLSGSGGNDTLAGDAGADVLNGGDGSDTLYGGSISPAWQVPFFQNNPDFVAPVLDRGADVDTLNGGAGVDTIYAGYGDIVDGGADLADLLISFAGATSGITVDFHQLDNGGSLTVGGHSITNIRSVLWIEGTNFADTITGSDQGGDFGTTYAPIFGLGGDDHLIAGANTGNIYGGDGNDTIDVHQAYFNGPGDQGIYYGEAGNDTITVTGDGSPYYPNAVAYGGDGDDTITLGGDAFGGAGNDTLIGVGTDYKFSADGGAGDDTLMGTDRGDTLLAGAGADTIQGEGGNDTIYTGDSSTVYGDPLAGADTGTEHDIVDAGTGDDTISAGFGDDVDGGAGTDSLHLSLIGATAGITLNVANLETGAAYVISGGTITNIEHVESLWGTEFNDVLTLSSTSPVYGMGGNDTITGTTGADQIHGGTGADTINAGGGNDQIYLDSASDAVAGERIAGGSGTDTLIASVQPGAADSDRLISLAGVTLSSIETLKALSGQLGITAAQLSAVTNLSGDFYLEDVGTYAFAGKVALSSITIEMNAGGGTLDLSGFTPNGFLIVAGGASGDTIKGSSYSDNIYSYGGNDVIHAGASDDNIQGADGNDVIYGDAGNDGLSGGAGDDLLDGGTGDDGMSGGTGNDTFVVDSDLDQTFENADEGTDTVQSSVDFFLGENIENLTLTGTASTIGLGNASNNVMIGNGGDNILLGDAGDDQLDGGAGIDSAAYAGASSGVTVSLARSGPQNTGGAGVDTLMNFEGLSGSAYSDTLTGDAAANTLAGANGDDTLHGAGGNDDLNGGAGDDLLDGGSGTDAADYSFATAGVTVNLAVSAAQDTGGAGVDTLSNIEDVVGSKYADTLQGDAASNKLTGGAGNDLLDGGAGVDSMYGGTGDDTFIVRDATDSVIENAGEGTDIVRSVVSFTLGANVENLTLTGTAGLTGKGNELANDITGNSGANYLYGYAGNDTLDGGAGNDKLFGGLGDDTYMVRDATDYAYENAGEGTDTVIALVSAALRANIENLTLTGTASIFGKGNELANEIDGNSGANRLSGLAGDDTLVGGGGRDILDGGTGSDTLTGGADNDIYVIDSSSDIIVENAGEGVDFVQTSASFTLSANVDRMYLLGSGNIDGTGNDLANLLVGNTGSNSLSGMGANDRLYGAAGADTLNGGDGNDYMEGGAGQDDLIGGGGKDYFVFRDGDFGGATAVTADRIEDFALGDRISLSPVDANTLAGGNQAFAFVGTAAFSHTAGELRYEQVGGNTFLSADTNGDGTADFMIKLDGLHTLTTSDLLL